MASNISEIFGDRADARSTATDTNAVSGISLLKEISYQVQAQSAGLVVLGQGANGGSVPVVQAYNAYETVAASQTAQVMGGTGATGDFIHGILVVPATTSPGNVLLLDNATSITVFTGGSTSVVDLKPFLIPLDMRSVSGAWKITTGANVSVIGIGTFSA